MRPIVLALLSLWVPTALRAQGRAFTPADWYRVTTVSSPAVSPDGRQVAFTVTTVLEKENRRHSEIWVVPSDGSASPRRLTSSSVESSSPRWSPDGRLLVFSSTRPGNTARSWALRMDGAGGEAFAYDSLPPGVSVSTDGQLMVWSEAAPRDSARAAKDTSRFAKMTPGARPPYGAITAPVEPTRFDGRHIVDLPYKSNNSGFLANPSKSPEWRPTEVWVRTPGGESKQLTDLPYSHRGAQVSPDGRWIAFTADPELRPDSAVRAEADSLGQLPYDAVRNEAARNTSDLFLVPAVGGTPRRLTTGNGNEGAVVWSPDSRQLAYVVRPTRTSQAQLMVAEASGGMARSLLDDWRYEPGSVTWLRTGLLAVSAAIGGRTALFTVDPRSGRRTEALGGRRRLSGFSFDDASSVVAYVSTSLTKPTELFVARPDGSNERQLSHFNDALNQEIAWADADRFTYRSVDNLEIEGWLMKPFGYEPGKRYPLALYIHGGPHSAYGENWFDEFQNLAGVGMFVLFTNPRGSAGYGADFTYATRGRWFAEDYQDLMRAVDIAAARPDVDSTRMGVTGGSYGGVMTAWVTVKTNRFKAAQVDRMISDWWSWYGSSDAQGLTEFEFFGKPWDNPAMYDSLSPIRYIRQVRTPTLMVQSEEDHRTPMTDAEQWFMGLQKQGTPVEWLRYPRSTHNLSRTGEPWLLVDRLGRLRQWFTHYLIPERSP